jgi:tetratricopeptide (TPR) repeat protein
MMKTKLTSILLLSVFTLTLSAQKGNVNSADYELTLDAPDLEKAEAKILEAEKNEKTINYPKTYFVKERILRAKYAKDNTDTESLFAALEALKKAEELDAKGDAKGKGIGKFKNDIKKDIIMLRIDFQNCGATAYNVKDYATALKCFEGVLAVDQMPSGIEEGAVASIDTAIVFNTAICAYYGNDTIKTKEYMTKCIEYNYGQSTPHTVMYVQYKAEADTAKMIATLVDGFEKHPEDATFLKELVVYYININNLEQGMKYITIALESDPENSSFWFTKGTFHDQSKEAEKAIEAYNTAIETADTEEDLYNANYNLGVIYYNEAVEAANLANEEKDFQKSKVQSEAAKGQFRECIPFFEACLSAKPNDLETLKALRPVYYRLSDDATIMTKYEKLQAAIKAQE